MSAYGHFFIDVPVTEKEEILDRAIAFFSNWQSIDVLKEKTAEFVEWEKRNPIEKRRAGEVNYETDPVPAEEFFALSEMTKRLILDL